MQTQIHTHGHTTTNAGLVVEELREAGGAGNATEHRTPSQQAKYRKFDDE